VQPYRYVIGFPHFLDLVCASPKRANFIPLALIDFFPLSLRPMVQLLPPFRIGVPLATASLTCARPCLISLVSLLGFPPYSFRFECPNDLFPLISWRSYLALRRCLLGLPCYPSVLRLKFFFRTFAFFLVQVLFRPFKFPPSCRSPRSFFKALPRQIWDGYAIPSGVNMSSIISPFCFTSCRWCLFVSFAVPSPAKWTPKLLGGSFLAFFLWQTCPRMALPPRPPFL